MPFVQLFRNQSYKFVKTLGTAGFDQPKVKKKIKTLTVKRILTER